MAQGEKRISNLLKSAGINENPSKLNDLGGILCHIHTVFIAGGRNVDHDVAVDVELGHLLRSHDGNGSAGSRQLACAGCKMQAMTVDAEAIAGPLAMACREGREDENEER